LGLVSLTVYGGGVRLFSLLAGVATGLFVAGCAAPFIAARSEPSQAAGVSVAFCGSSKVTAEKLLRAAEPPSDLPTEVGGSGGLAPPEEASFCLKVDNHGRQTVRVDRSYLQLLAPHEKQPWIPDTDDQEVIVHAGEAKQLHVSFHYSPMPSGEDLKLLLESAFTVEGRRLKIAPLPIRKN
jgi:hypothetical protein